MCLILPETPLMRVSDAHISTRVLVASVAMIVSLMRSVAGIVETEAQVMPQEMISGDFPAC